MNPPRHRAPTVPPDRRPEPRERGVAAIIAMMFLVIFGSLAAAMAIVSQGGLRSAESHLKIGRAHAAAETGLDLIEWRLAQAFAGRTGTATLDAGLTPVRSPQGVVDDALATEMWGVASTNLAAILTANAPIGGSHLQGGVFRGALPGGSQVQVFTGSIRVGPGQPDFSARVQPHPLPDEDYSDPYYDRMPYGPPGGDPAGTAWQRAVHEQDMAVKAAAGIAYVVGDPDAEGPEIGGLPVQKLDARFLRVTVEGVDQGTFNAAADGEQRTASRAGAEHSVVRRTLRQDYRLTKTIPYALLSRSRIMLGRNVSVDGPINSRFSQVGLAQGHPVQIESDLLGFSDDLDEKIRAFSTNLAGGTGQGVDLDNDNRINLNSPSETEGIPGFDTAEGPRQFIADNDFDGDGYVSEFDYFIEEFDDDKDGTVTADEFDVDSDPSRAQLFRLINLDSSPDTFINEEGKRVPRDHGSVPDGLNALDRYAKIRGEVRFEPTIEEWTRTGTDAGAASAELGGTGRYQDYLQGPITPDFGQAALVDGDTDTDALFEFGPESFDTSAYADRADNTNALATADVNDVARADEVVRDGRQVRVGSGDDETVEYRSGREPQEGEDLFFEEVPYRSDFAYDHFDRPVYRNLRFTNARIPPGTNALFENCVFFGVTYIETAADNGDENFNYAGIQDANGLPTYWDRPVEIDGVRYGGDGTQPGDRIEGTKELANNIRFHNCTFQGPVSGGPVGGGSFPPGFEFTHTRNKVTFTGRTQWNADIAGGPELSEADRDFFARSSILLPHFSVEIGSFRDADSLAGEVRLEGTVVAGIIDIRGQADVNGTIVTTFEPVAGEGPVIGDTSPNFNTTLGFFGRDEGDFESSRTQDAGLGRIRLRYNPLATLPDGIDSPITLVPLPRTFSE